jgi:hypothetical protein
MIRARRTDDQNSRPLPLRASQRLIYFDRFMTSKAQNEAVRAKMRLPAGPHGSGRAEPCGRLLSDVSRPETLGPKQTDRLLEDALTDAYAASYGE